MNKEPFDDDLSDLFREPEEGVRLTDWTTKRQTWKPSTIAAELKITARAVQLWCEQQLLPATTTRGGHYRIAAKDLRTYLNGHADSLAA